MPTFPLRVRVPPFDKSGGMRQFGWRRSGGARLHAGCDLYAPVGTPVYAIADGVFLWRRSFYLGTDEVAIYHPGIGVVRYGEVLPANKYAAYQRQIKAGYRASGVTTAPERIAAPRFSDDPTVTEGAIIAVVGKLTGLSMSMVHLELYGESAKEAKSLSGYGNIYRRHPALLDPTRSLLALQRGQGWVAGDKPAGAAARPTAPSARRKAPAAVRTRPSARTAGRMTGTDRRKPAARAGGFSRTRPTR